MYRRYGCRVLVISANSTARRVGDYTASVKDVGKMRNLIAIGLTLWFAGMACLLLRCTQAVSNYDAGPAIEKSTAQSLMPGANASCHAHLQQHRRLTISETAAATGREQVIMPMPVRSDAMSCCPLANGSIVTTSRSQANDEISFIAADASTPFSFTSSDSAPPAVPLRLPNQHHLYLRGCVFLI